MSDRLTDLEMVLHHETHGAVLVSLHGDRDEAVWLPKSQCQVEIKSGSKVEVTLKESLAIEKGLV